MREKRVDIFDGLIVAGAGAMVYGLIRWDEPAAYVAVGAFVVVLGLLIVAAPRIFSRKRE